MYYHDHLLVDVEHPLKFVVASFPRAKTRAEAMLDTLYADELPQPPDIRRVDIAHCPNALHPRHAAEWRALR